MTCFSSIILISFLWWINIWKNIYEWLIQTEVGELACKTNQQSTISQHDLIFATIHTADALKWRPISQDKINDSRTCKKKYSNEYDPRWSFTGQDIKRGEKSQHWQPAPLPSESAQFSSPLETLSQASFCSEHRRGGELELSKWVNYSPGLAHHGLLVKNSNSDLLTLVVG